jgi:hypothetical protein
MQSWQIMNPQRQLQQKGTVLPQQWQVLGPFRRRRDRLAGRDSVSFIVYAQLSEVLLLKMVNGTMRPLYQSDIN